MRVLVSVVPGYGHLQPLLPLATALADAGHEVVIATGRELCPRAEAAGFVAFEAGLSIAIAFQQLAERFPDGEYNRLPTDGILTWFLPHLFGEVLAPAMLQDLAPLVEWWQPDVMVHDSWEFAAPLAAACVGRPSISQTLGLRFHDPLLRSVAVAVSPLWRQSGLEPDPNAGVYRALCFDITPPSFQPYAADSHADVIRPLRPVAHEPLGSERLPDWMDWRRDVPLVYFTLGTNTNTNLSMFRAVIDGLSDLDVELLVTIGFGRDPASIGLLPENVHVHNYVTQSLVLAHCSAVVCHGGSGTTLAALAAGLPLLILPQGADQYLNGDHVVSSGAGLRLVKDDVTPASVRTSVISLLTLPTFRAAARQLQCEIASMPAPQEVVPIIEEVVAKGGTPAGCC